MCIMHPKYKSTPATNSCNRGGFIRKGVLTLPAPFSRNCRLTCGIKILCMYAPAVKWFHHYGKRLIRSAVVEQSTHNAVSSIRCPFRKSE